MGLLYSIHLDDHHHERTVFRCSYCYNHLFTSNNIISENFRGKHGKGFLVSRVVNYKTTVVEKRSMLTGDYSVCDTYCQHCNSYLGWKYVKAHNKDEIYKEGRFVMEIPQLLGVDRLNIKGIF